MIALIRISAISFGETTYDKLMPNCPSQSPLSTEGSHTSYFTFRQGIIGIGCAVPTRKALTLLSLRMSHQFNKVATDIPSGGRPIWTIFSRDSGHGHSC